MSFSLSYHWHCSQDSVCLPILLPVLYPISFSSTLINSVYMTSSHLIPVCKTGLLAFSWILFFFCLVILLWYLGPATWRCPDRSLGPLSNLHLVCSWILLILLLPRLPDSCPPLLHPCLPLSSLLSFLLVEHTWAVVSLTVSSLIFSGFLLVGNLLSFLRDWVLPLGLYQRVIISRYCLINKCKNVRSLMEKSRSILFFIVTILFYCIPMRKFLKCSGISP